MQMEAAQVANGRQASAARVEPPSLTRGPLSQTSWRFLYSAHPRLMPTVYVPGPVVTARKA